MPDIDDVAEEALKVRAHPGRRRRRIVPPDRGRNGGVLPDDERHPTLLRQGELPEAVDLHLHLLHEPPDARMPGGLRDGGVKGFIGAMEGLLVAVRAGLALPLQDRLDGGDLDRADWGKISISPSSASRSTASRTGVRLTP